MDPHCLYESKICGVHHELKDGDPEIMMVSTNMESRFEIQVLQGDGKHKLLSEHSTAHGWMINAPTFGWPVPSLPSKTPMKTTSTCSVHGLT